MHQQDRTQQNGPAPDRGSTGRNSTETAVTTVTRTTEGGDTRCS